ncbi:neurotensin/neuromedin N [Eucyclogobius newberryi]|uniref:neurotensin/neuromedin N n=1 Tax=Eucyclogobius newberryi TaxID=166745 RepID=UPI003B5BFACB
MQVPLVCVLLLSFTCAALCSELDSGQRALTQEILSSLISTKMRPSKQSAPSWRVSVSTLCRLVTSGGDEGWSQERADQDVDQEEAELSDQGPAPSREELYGLRLLCRMLQSQAQRLESLELLEENAQVPLKRTSPYILKRQTPRNSKSRRPYILKRSSVY